MKRQTNADYRAAVLAISEGDKPGKHGTKLAEGIAALDKMGAIVELDGEERFIIWRQWRSVSETAP